jgi:hypothetical protein
MIIDQTSAEPQETSDEIPGDANEIILTPSPDCPTCAEYAMMRHNPNTEAVIAFLDGEIRRLRWEITQVITVLPAHLVCGHMDCQWLQQGRAFPHVRNSECRPA